MVEIINQSSPIDEPANFQQTLLSIEDFLQNWARRSDLPSPENEFPPVFLLSELDFSHQVDGLYDEDKDNDEDEYEYEYEIPERPATEFLGVYQRRREGCNFTARILLCPERIMSSAHDYPDGYRVIFTKVLIHELAHSVMDFCMENRAFVGKTKGFKCIEESCANLITLIAIEYKFPEWLTYVRQFVHSQPWNYRFGGTLYDFAYFDLKSAVLFVNAWRKRKLVYCKERKYLLASNEVMSGNVMRGLGLLGALSVAWNNSFEKRRRQVRIF